MNKSAFDYKLEILMKEWDYVQSHIGRLDSIIFNIRGWAISAFTAMIAISATQKIPNLMLLAMLPVLMFWFIDALHKNFQLNFILRGREIETYLASNALLDDAKWQSGISITAPDLSGSFRKRPFFDRVRRVLKAATLWNVWIIYSAMLCLCALSYLFLHDIR
jgi:hypothetical protein